MLRALSFMYRHKAHIATTLATAAIVVLAPAFLRIDHGHIALHLNAAEAAWTFSGMMREFVAWIGLLFISFGALILTISGALFDVLMDWTIINFAQHLADNGLLSSISGANGGVAPGQGSIEVVWTAFRDISNIVIIGMFIFVGVCTILGIDEFGYKKFIARLLIVAILINFSLFFTKITIDISHALAGTFYKALGVQIEGTNSSGTVVSGSNEAVANAAGNNLTGAKGIAGAFMTAMGISGTYTAQKNELVKIGEQADSTFMILWVAILTTIMLIALAVVLFYGCFLLGTRGVLLIFLLLSSSFAFGSFMIPKFRDHDYGWKGWLDTLIRSALFAPLFLLFLWMVLFVLRQVPASAKSNVAGFAVDATNPAVWTSTIIYILSLGLLYVSMKVAKSFSSNVGLMGSSFKIADMTVGAGKTSAIFGLNASRYMRSANSQRVMNSTAKDRMISLANAGDVKAQRSLDKHTKQARGEFGGTNASMTKNLDKFAKIFTQGAGKGGAAAAEKEHEKHENEKVEKGLAMMAPSSATQTKVIEASIQEAKNTIKAGYMSAYDEHKQDPQAIEAEKQRKTAMEQELATITEKAKTGPLNKTEISRKDKLAMDIKAVGSKITQTQQAIDLAKAAEKSKKSLDETVEDHIEETQDTDHKEQITNAINEGKRKINDMTTKNREAYLTRAEPNQVRREQVRSALKKSADEKKLQAVAKNFAKLGGLDQPEAPKAAAAPAAATPAANPPPAHP